jgi:hypothetical protein
LNSTGNDIDTFSFLTNAGEIGQLIRDKDWSRTCIGPMDQWPVSLRVTIANLLHTSFPMFLFWGDDFLCFYNEAFRPSLGVTGKHPAIGKKAIVVWGDIWHFIGPLIQKVIVTHEPVWFEDQLVPFERNGKVEDIYWTFSYSPAFAEGDVVKGVLVTCIETTASVLARRENTKT